MGYIPESREEDWKLDSPQSATTIQDRWQQCADVQAFDLPPQKVPIWKNNRQLLNRKEEYEWMELPPGTSHHLKVLLEAEHAYVNGECTSFLYPEDIIERPILTSTAAIRLALSPPAWVPAALPRKEDTVPPRSHIIEADKRDEYLELPRRIYQGLSRMGQHYPDGLQPMTDLFESWGLLDVWLECPAFLKKSAFDFYPPSCQNTPLGTEVYLQNCITCHG